MEKLVISSSVLVAAAKLIKASARSSEREISRENVPLPVRGEFARRDDVTRSLQDNKRRMFPRGCQNAVCRDWEKRLLR